MAIAANSADATALHYQKDLIIERINQVFGERWITSVRFVNVPSNARPKNRKKPKAPLTESEKKTLSDIVFEIEDDSLRARLQNLGQAIIMDNKS